MKKFSICIQFVLFTGMILLLCFGACLVLQYFFEDSALISAIFVVGVFLISVITPGYAYGIASALLSVLAVNFAFTFPFFAFSFTMPENIVSAVILLVVTLVTCTLTAKLKHQEAIKAESERERMRANLLRAVSHDLRTPLTTIYGASSALLENYGEFSDEQCKKMLKGISEDSQWLSRMVENLLSITRLDGGKVKIIKTDTVLDELIDSVLIKFAKRYPTQAVDVDLPEEFVLIPMDALLMEQVIINLLENAVQHAEGMTQLYLKVFVLDKKAIFEIADNGCGIEKDRLDKIFTEYYDSKEQSSDMQKRNYGIGLSVCATIIAAHGGSIKAENAKDGGAIFRFVLSTEVDPTDA